MEAVHQLDRGLAFLAGSSGVGERTNVESSVAVGVEVGSRLVNVGRVGLVVEGMIVGEGSRGIGEEVGRIAQRVYSFGLGVGRRLEGLFEHGQQ